MNFLSATATENRYTPKYLPMMSVFPLSTAGFEEWTTRPRLKIEEADLHVNDIFARGGDSPVLPR
jgi:hypothetical protein